jgi:hypothetical protein
MHTHRHTYLLVVSHVFAGRAVGSVALHLQIDRCLPVTPSHSSWCFFHDARKYRGREHECTACARYVIEL